jgi:hypothetical protein
MGFSIEVYKAKKYGKLKPGDIGRFSDDFKLYRYLGVAPVLPPGVDIRGTFLVFEDALLINPTSMGGGYKFIPVSKYTGDISGRADILEKKVSDLEVIGNIPEQVWSLLHHYQMETADKMKLGGDKFGEDNVHNLLLAYYLREQGKRESKG